MTPAFLAAAALLVLLVTLGLLWPLLRRGRQLAARRDYDLAIYRDQLAEIERDRSRGVLTSAEAEAARLEVQRRLLAADRRGQGERQDGTDGNGRSGRRDWFTPLAIGILVPGLALGLYLILGRPDVPSIDFAEQQAMRSDMDLLVERLQARLDEEPGDPRGWELLGRSYLQLGRSGEAAQAFREALAKGGPKARLEASLGEALVAAAGGAVGPEARAAFARALEADPAEPRARYYAGLALAQDGRTDEALRTWRDLVDASPPDAPWLPMLRNSIAALSGQTGEAPGATGPTREQVEAAGEMTDEERSAFIRSMVERLAARLEQQPDDVEGWLRLVQARLVLGEREAALEALSRAEEQVAGRPADDLQRQAVEQARQQFQQQESTR